MSKCPYCKIEVGGDLKKCPLCQSKVMGEAEDAYFPKLTTLQIRSFFYKLQLFVVWIIVIVTFSIDFLFDIQFPAFPEVHWSLIVAMWTIAFEFGIMRQFKSGTGSSRKMTMMVTIILILLLITSYYFGFFRITADWIAPMALIGAMVANFVLAMIDKRGTSMSYLLGNLLVGVIPYIVLCVRHHGSPVGWILCVVFSVILFVGAVIFKGRTVTNEIRRRLDV